MINLSFNVIQFSLMFTLVVGMIVAAAKKPRPKEQEAKTQKPQSHSGKKKKIQMKKEWETKKVIDSWIGRQTQ